MQLQAVLVEVGGTLWSERVWDAREQLAAVRKQRLEAAGVPRSAIDTLTVSLAEGTRGADGLEYFDIRRPSPPPWPQVPSPSRRNRSGAR